MTVQRDHASGGTAGKGLLLTLLAVIVGFFLLARAFDTSGGSLDASGVSSDDSGDAAVEDSERAVEDSEQSEPGVGDGSAVEVGDEALSTGTTTTSTLAPPPSTRPPGEVKTVTVNGTGRRRLAGAAAEVLVHDGYVARAKNAASPPVGESNIFYLPSYSDDAKAVAAAIRAPASILNQAPENILTLIANPEDVSDFHIFVVLGTDSLIPVNP